MKKLLLFLIFLVIFAVFVDFKKNNKTEVSLSETSSKMAEQILEKITHEEKTSPLESRTPTQKNSAETAIPSFEEYEDNFLKLSNEEIELEIKSIKNVVASKSLIEKANRKTETHSEKLLLNESIRKIGALYKILMDRKLEEMKGRI